MKKLIKEVYLGNIEIHHGRMAYHEFIDKILQLTESRKCTNIDIQVDEFNGDVDINFYSQV